MNIWIEHISRTFPKVWEFFVSITFLKFHDCSRFSMTLLCICSGSTKTELKHLEQLLWNVCWVYLRKPGNLQYNEVFSFPLTFYHQSRCFSAAPASRWCNVLKLICTALRESTPDALRCDEGASRVDNDTRDALRGSRRERRVTGN